MSDHSYLANGAPTTHRVGNDLIIAGEVRSRRVDDSTLRRLGWVSKENVQRFGKFSEGRETGQGMQPNETARVGGFDTRGIRPSPMDVRRTIFDYSILVENTTVWSDTLYTVARILDSLLVNPDRDLRVRLVVEEVVRETRTQPAEDEAEAAGGVGYNNE